MLNKEAFDQAGLIYGMGHAVYSLSDPRSKILSRFVKQLSEEKGKEDEYQLYATVEGLAANRSLVRRERCTRSPCKHRLLQWIYLQHVRITTSVIYTIICDRTYRRMGVTHRMEELMNGNRIIRPAYKAVAPHRGRIYTN